MKTKYICIHGHFYQPPRENAWIEEIELQETAHPYPDWNRRICAECYIPNAFAPLFASNGFIKKIINNYSLMSFNFGPTLLTWIEKQTPDLYQAILDADKQSQAHFSGHGSALAQVYNHIIMPLASRRDKYTQTFWGIRDFEYRFKRLPEGMWLPETAVDLETLSVMAELGLRFTILSPHQAGRIRPIGSKKWSQIKDGALDTSIPYRQPLPNGGEISIYFYRSDLSHAAAFGKTLASGKTLLEQLKSAFDAHNPDRIELIHTAMDGETYGHHRGNGDLALAYALEAITKDPQVQLTNYGEFLDIHPPTHEVDIIENSSWSCRHGIERWRADCGCCSNFHNGWHQKWRAPLRDSLDWLRDEMHIHFESRTKSIFKDPFAARNDYIHILLEDGFDTFNLFLNQQHLDYDSLEPDQTINIRKLLEMQRYAMLMYTSCGWFFDDVSGIETVQIIQYAYRALELMAETGGADLKEAFLDRLETIPGNLPDYSSGRLVFEKKVQPNIMNLNKIAANLVIIDLFDNDKTHSLTGYSFSIRKKIHGVVPKNNTRYATGQIRLESQRTGEQAKFYFYTAFTPPYHVNCGVSSQLAPSFFSKLNETLSAELKKEEIAFELKNRFATNPPLPNFGMSSLFKNLKHRVLAHIFSPIQEDALSYYQDIWEKNFAAIAFIRETGNLIPPILEKTGNLVLNTRLKTVLGILPLKVDQARFIVDQALKGGILLDAVLLEYIFGQTLQKLMDRLIRTPQDIQCRKDLLIALNLAIELPFAINLRQIQYFFYKLLQNEFPNGLKKSNPSNGIQKNLLPQLAKTLMISTKF